VLDGGQGSIFRSGSINPTNEPHGTHYVGGCVCSSAIWALWRRDTFLVSPGIRFTIPWTVA
jgi:hypothetical protein